MEKCDRCGEVDEDRRTLWMACFYKMEELGLPFKDAEVFDIDKKHLKRTKRRRIMISQSYDMDKKGLGPKKRIPYKEDIVTARGRVQPRHLYTLRVCKDCRATWMNAIKDWFTDGPKELEPVNSGIFVRRNGATVEISEAEWYAQNPGREPVRIKP